MAHFGKHHHKRQKTDKSWLPVTAQIGEIANRWSGRNDLVAYVGLDGGRGEAPALFDPDMREIEVNSEIAFGEFVRATQVGDFTQRKTLFEWSKAAGAVLHEAMHAAHSIFDLRESAKVLDRGEMDALTILEESRIEANGVRDFPKDRVFLRACAMDIVMSDMTEDGLESLSATRQAARLAALTMARVDAGVLDQVDVKTVRSKVEEIIPLNVRKKLRRIWREFQNLEDFDIERMHELAKEWYAAVEEQAKENGEPEEGEQGSFGGMPMPGEGGEGGGGQEMTEEQAKAFADMMDALGKDAMDAMIESQKAVRGQRTKEAQQAAAKAAGEQHKEQAENKKVSMNTFERSIGPNGTRSNSRLRNKRKPTAEEKRAANRIARAMEKARYRDRVQTEHSSIVPPGRLRVGTAMQGVAIKSQGGQNTTEPFRRRQRKHVEDPNLTLGLMCDISGSMSSTMRPMAVAAWVMSEAVRRVQGKAAGVYYGNDVFSVLKPGQHLTEVMEYDAADGTEEFDKAFRSLDGALNLLQGRGARLLVICSDGNYRPHEEEACRKWLKRCASMRVGVVWLGFKSGRAQEYCKDAGAHYVEIGNDVMAASAAIGQACTDALNAAGRAR